MSDSSTPILKEHYDKKKKKQHLAEGGMAQQPLMFDDLVSDQDPQSALGAQGVKTIAESQPVQQVMSNIQTGAPLKEFYQQALAAGQGDPEAQKAIADKSLNVAMGTVRDVKELPMDEASRLSRAKSMGFDTSKTYYHGSNSDFKKFNPEKAPDDKSGETFELGNRIAGFFTESPEFANRFTTSNGPGVVYPVKLRVNNPFDYENQKHLYAVIKKLPKDYFTNLAKELPQINGKDMTPKQIKQQMALGNWSFFEKPEVIDAIQDAGHDAMYVYENGNKNIAVFNPSQIRSKFAQFNPKRKNWKDISAGIAGATGLGAAGLAGNADTFTHPQAYADGGSVTQPLMFDDLPGHPTAQNDSQMSLSTTNGTQNPSVGANSKLSSFDDLVDDNEKYETPGQYALTGLEGAARGVVGPLAPMAELASGLTTKEAIRGRQEANPITAGVGEVAGLAGSMLTGVGEGAIAAKVGKKALSKLPLLTDSLVGKLGASAITGAIENSIIQGSDEVSRMILQDPNQSAQTALLDIGAAGLFGAAAGPVFPGIGAGLAKSLKATEGSKIGQIIADFKGRMDQHLSNPDPVQAVTKELGDHYKQLQDLAFDAKGLQLQDIAKSIPEMHEGMIGKTNEIISNVESKIEKMVEKPYQYPQRLTAQLAEDVQGFKAQLADAQSPAEMFKSVDDFKRKLQGWSKYDSRVQSIDEEYHFIKAVKGLASDTKQALEDNKVWGEAATRQKEINAATSDFIPALKDFEKKFTSKLEGDLVIDPAKVQTYLNQVGSARGELKQSMLGNFLHTSEKYLDQIDKIHHNLGIESPVERSSLTLSKATLDEQTLGSKLADFVAHKSLATGGGAGLGAATGATLGGMIGVPHAIGAILGAHAAGPFISHVLQGITKPILNTAVKVGGVLSAAEFGAAVAKGERILDKASKAILISGREVLSKALFPTEKDRMKLDRQLEDIRQEPQKMLGIAGNTGHYLPNHATSLAETAGRISNYLNTLKPKTDPKAPLDSKRAISDPQMAEYNNALNIAQQPLIVLSRLKDGNMTSKDVAHLKIMYPDLYNRMADKLLAEVVVRNKTGESIPYKTRLGISMFLGQPMDSTMSPMAIVGAQPIMNPQEQQGLTAQMARKPSQTGLNQLSKGLSVQQPQEFGRALSRQKH